MDPSVSGREQSGIFPEEPRENGRNFNPSLPNAPAEMRQEVSADVHEVVGDRMRNVPGFHDASNAVRASLADSSLHNVRREQAFTASSQPYTPNRQSRNTDHHPSPQKLTGELLTSAAISGGLGATLVGVPTYIAAGALPAAALAGTVGWQAAVGGATTYGLGMVHNAFWRKKGQPLPGRFGTFLRGIIAPISIPVGLVRNLTWNRKG